MHDAGRSFVPVPLILAAAWIMAEPAASRAAPTATADQRAAYEQMVSRSVRFLAARQAEDGSFSSFAGTGPTSLVATALLQHGRTAADPVVARCIDYLLKNAQQDGGIYQADSFYRNYETCLAIMCLSAANAGGRYEEPLKKAEAFVRGLQWDGEEGKDPAAAEFGGAGYGRDSRPDLPNTQFLLEALESTGADAEDEAVQRALLFVSRCQNLETEHNTLAFSTKNPDGGFIYTAAGGGSSAAGDTENGGLRSYGAMTYAGLKSMIFAGVKPDDPRVKAAIEWARKNYSLQKNPGLGDAGLYYYYHLMAKALDALGEETFVDGDGKEHRWRAELRSELAGRQDESGGWVNTNKRWLEGDANLVTAYALLALSYCKP